MKHTLRSYLGLVYKHLPWTLDVAYKAAKIARVVIELVDGPLTIVRNYDHRFPLDNGVQIYVQDAASRQAGVMLCHWIDKRWRPPAHFYHFRAGGHVAAARLHQDAAFLLTMDLRRFFDQVSRTKVHRALRAIRFSSADAYDLSCQATVMKDRALRAYSLPLGFVQSMHLASLALDRSALGRAIRGVIQSGVRVSVYVDDVILSADREDMLNAARECLEAGAQTASFAFHPDKCHGPADTVPAFNLRIGRRQLIVSNTRFAQFLDTVRRAPSSRAEAVIAYVATVNVAQARALAVARAAAGF